MTKKIQIVGGIVPQSNWNQTDESQADYIKNKPEEVEGHLVNFSYNENGDPGIVYKSDSETVVFRGLTSAVHDFTDVRIFASNNDMLPYLRILARCNSDSASGSTVDGIALTTDYMDIEVSEIGFSVHTVGTGVCITVPGHHSVGLVNSRYLSELETDIYELQQKANELQQSVTWKNI